MRPTYCTPLDAYRRFDPTVTASELESSGFYDSGVDGRETVVARIEEVEDDFDEKTNNPQRLAYAGGGPDAWEFHDATFRKHQGGVKVYLDHDNVVPIDYDKGDRIQVRSTRRGWRDITQDDDVYRLNYSDGVLQLFGMYRFTGRGFRNAIESDSIRVQYRHGALGGSRRRSGQTELGSELTAGATTMDLVDADRLPRSGVVLVGGEEYVEMTSVDRDADTATIKRGKRGTADTTHSAGTGVHYCRMGVRSGVAARVAVELLHYDDFVVQLADTESGVRPADKREDWMSEWESALGRFSGAVML